MCIYISKFASVSTCETRNRLRFVCGEMRCDCDTLRCDVMRCEAMRRCACMLSEERGKIPVTGVFDGLCRAAAVGMAWPWRLQPWVQRYD